MDIHEFLTPVPYQAKPKSRSNYQTFDLINFNDFEQINSNSIVICALNEYQQNIEFGEEHFSNIRKHFYQLSKSNWSKTIFDIGTVSSGNTFEDSCFALHQITREISKKKATLVVLGGSQSLTYILYQAIQKDLAKIGTIDIKLDIDGTVDALSNDNYITQMILNEENRLLDFFNLGSQAPYVAKEELDILEQLNFENIRLGSLTSNLTHAEPFLRELDLLSVDMNVMQYESFKSSIKLTPNGFNTREICGLMRYAGLNDNIKVLHLSNFNPNCSQADAYTLAEMMWYFIEAQNNQKSDADLQTYRVQLEEDEIIFIKSKNSERWWVQILIDDKKRNIPCNHNDYLTALSGEYPDIWLKFYKKFY